MKLRKLKPAMTSRVSSLKLPTAVAAPRPGAAATKSNGVPLKLVAPTARQVFIAGSFNNWQAAAAPLKCSPDGEWVAELKLAPGRYEYLFVVDGQWLPDPTAHEATPNPFGGANSVIHVA